MEKWTSERLDDRFGAIERELERLSRAAETMTSLPGRFDELADDTRSCREGVAQLRASMDERGAQRARERIAALERAEQEAEAKRIEKKKDRRYILGVSLSVAALILTGVGILVSLLP